MKHGVAMFPIHDGIGPPDLARAAEERGFESLFFPEHTHIPASRESHFDPAGGELPRAYWNTLDPFVALTAAAGVTRELRLATGICLVAQRDPITTAKSVASLDVLSGGRFLFGIGAGWNREEMRNHGTDPDRRFRRMRENVQAMREIWTHDEASFAGEWTSFERIWAWPKPIQQPHPPILIGGAGPRVEDRVMAYGDEWLAEPEDGLEDRIARLLERATTEGHGDSIAVTVYGCEPGDAARWERAGAHRCVYWLPAADERSVVRELDDLAAVIS
jgi:probable F420-dependent oxidoreductase